jgi:hypothetical protein
VQNLSKRLDGLEVSNTKLIQDAIQELKQHVQTPNSINGDCTQRYSSGPSPDVADKRRNLKNETDWVKNRENLKNVGTIEISDGEENGSSGKKRTRSTTTFVRGDEIRKCQNTNKGKQVVTDTSRINDDDSPQGVGNKPFNSDYRRGVSGKVLTKKLGYTCMS